LKGKLLGSVEPDLGLVNLVIMVFLYKAEGEILL
jgi:hypothetical protein